MLDLGKPYSMALLGSASEDGIYCSAQMSLQRDEFGRQDRNALRQIDDQRPLAPGAAASALLTGTARMPPRPLATGGRIRSVMDPRGVPAYPDFLCAGYRA